MARHRIINETNGYQFKASRVEREINRTVVWVIKGYTVRNMDAAELYDAMNEQAVKRAKLEASLGHREGPGLIFQPPESGVPATRREKFLNWQARYFVKNGVMPDLKAAA